MTYKIDYEARKIIIHRDIFDIDPFVIDYYDFQKIADKINADINEYLHNNI